MPWRPLLQLDEWQYNNSDPWMGTRHSNCTSCGGPFVALEYDPNDPHAYMGYWGRMPADACAPGTRLITEEDNYGGMYWFEPPGRVRQSAMRAITSPTITHVRR